MGGNQVATTDTMTSTRRFKLLGPVSLLLAAMGCGMSAAGGAGPGGAGGSTAAGLGGSTVTTTGGTAGSTAGGAPGSAAGHGGAAGAAAGTSGAVGAAGTPGAAGSGAGGAAGAAGAGGATLDPTPGNYQRTCDGSLGVMIDATHFLDGNDETQGMRLYTRGASGAPLQTIDISSAIGLATSDEADLEDMTRVGNRIYVTGSHGRNKSGDLERSRYRFFAMDLTGTSPDIKLTVPGYTTTLLDQMLVAANWVTPDADVIATLDAAANLTESSDADLAPKVDGTNIEGLTAAPTATRPNQLLIGFRNPTQNGDAIVVSLLNADDVLTGATPQFGEAALLDLDGLGIRGMTWSAVHQAVLFLAGPQDGSNGPFRLFEWSGAPLDAPVLVQEITNAPTDSAPEAIVTYPGTRDVQILFDQGDQVIDGDACKDADASDQFFTDAIVYVP
jgi:hypothetical protein